MAKKMDFQIGPTGKRGKNGQQVGTLAQKWVIHGPFPIFGHFFRQIYFFAIISSYFGPEARFGVCTGQSGSIQLSKSARYVRIWVFEACWVFSGICCRAPEDLGEATPAESRGEKNVITILAIFHCRLGYCREFRNGNRCCPFESSERKTHINFFSHKLSVPPFVPGIVPGTNPVKSEDQLDKKFMFMCLFLA